MKDPNASPAGALRVREPCGRETEVKSALALRRKRESVQSKQRKLNYTYIFLDRFHTPCLLPYYLLEIYFSIRFNQSTYPINHIRTLNFFCDVSSFLYYFFLHFSFLLSQRSFSLLSLVPTSSRFWCSSRWNWSSAKSLF